MEPLQVQLLRYVKEKNLPQGAHLKEQDLANAMGVSRTPIRKALALLAEAGVVEARRHRGFFLQAPASDLMFAAVELPVTTDRQLFDCIAMDRLDGNLPGGARTDGRGPANSRAGFRGAVAGKPDFAGPGPGPGHCA